MLYVTGYVVFRVVPILCLATTAWMILCLHCAVDTEAGALKNHLCVICLLHQQIYQVHNLHDDATSSLSYRAFSRVWHINGLVVF